MNKHHELKTWPGPFLAIQMDRKKAEFRKNDRNFSWGDYVTLREYDNDTKEYSGKVIEIVITDICYGSSFGIPKGYCMFSFNVLKEGRMVKS